jgi:hypothetical protein
MENIRTIAVIGASEERNFQYSKNYQSVTTFYYSITIKKHLRIFMKALWRKTAMAMRNGLCPKR